MKKFSSSSPLDTNPSAVEIDGFGRVFAWTSQRMCPRANLLSPNDSTWLCVCRISSSNVEELSVRFEFVFRTILLTVCSRVRLHLGRSLVGCDINCAVTRMDDVRTSRVA
jgi:hypothetical protein